MGRRISLPSLVALPAATSRLPAATVYQALGISSRQRAFQLRRRHGFPVADGGTIDAAAVAAWAVARGVKVTFI